MTDETENAKSENAKNDQPTNWRAEAEESDTDPLGATSSFYESVEIELLPGGRVRMDSPQDPFVLEVQFHPLSKRRQRKPPRTSGSWNLFGGDITEVQFLARPRERIDQIPTFSTGICFAYFRALKAYLESLDEEASWLRLPRRALPQQGKRTDPAIYRELLARFEQLKLRGSTRPAADLAEQLGVNRATVRTWLKRARQIKETP